MCEGYDRGMRTHRSIAAVLTGGLVAAATLFTAPAAEAAPGYTTVVQWAGGKTKACRVDDPVTGTSRVKVSWDGRGYLRLSAQVYNREEDFQRLVEGLPKLLRH